MTREINEGDFAVISRMVEVHAPCHPVLGYELDDIKQEAYIICLSLYEKWDGVRPLENYLSVCLSRKLSSFVRDKYKLQGQHAEVNSKIMRPLDIDSMNWDEPIFSYADTVGDEVDYKDLVAAIDQYLPVSLRRDYLQMKAGVHINRGRQKKIREYINLLLMELRGEESEDEVDE